MKLKTRSDNITRGGVQATKSSKYGIVAGPKAYSILSDKLYSNKVRAVIREISTNACDAHVLNGNQDKDFHVHLPNALEPYFAVRDFGPGMEPDMVEENYCVYFNSTKNESNKFNGALGLGCKSPFAYNDTFMLTVWNGGKKRIYESYMQNGEPFIDLKLEVESDEPTGIEVKVPVRSEDISRFADEARFVYAFFDKHPKVKGNPEYFQVEREQDSSGLHKITKSLPGHQYGTLFARMSNVGYPIPREYYEKTLFGLTVMKSRSDCIVMDFDNGALDFQPSREALSFDNETIDVLKRRFEESSADVQAKMDALYDQVKDMTPIEAYKVVTRELSSNFNPLYNWFSNNPNYTFADPVPDSDRAFSLSHNGRATLQEWNQMFTRQPAFVPSRQITETINGAVTKHTKIIDGGYSDTLGQNKAKSRTLGTRYGTCHFGTNIDHDEPLHVAIIGDKGQWRRRVDALRVKHGLNFNNKMWFIKNEQWAIDDLKKWAALWKNGIVFYNTDDVTAAELKDVKQKLSGTVAVSRPTEMKVYNCVKGEIVNTARSVAASEDIKNSLEGIYLHWYMSETYHDECRTREISYHQLENIVRLTNYTGKIYGVRTRNWNQASQNKNLIPIMKMFYDWMKDYEPKAEISESKITAAFRSIMVKCTTLHGLKGDRAQFSGSQWANIWKVCNEITGTQIVSDKESDLQAICKIARPDGYTGGDDLLKKIQIVYKRLLKEYNSKIEDELNSCTETIEKYFSNPAICMIANVLFRGYSASKEDVNDFINVLKQVKL